MDRAVSNSQKRKNSRPEFKSNAEKEILIGSYDFIVLFTVILLVLFGVIMVFSASYYSAGSSSKYNFDMYYFLKKQIVFSFLGFLVLFFFNNWNYNNFKRFALYMYIVSVILLILVLFIGTKVNGAKRWIQLGPISFQPSEVAKICLIIYLSLFIVNNKNILDTWKGFFQCVAVVMVPALLIGVENMSTCLVIISIGMSIIFAASPKFRYFLLGIPAVGMLALYLVFGGGFRSERISAWLNPFSDTQGVGYQTVQSLYAIASGGVFGLGLGQSRQKLGYIPEGHNDIIFAIICEELGMIGAGILIFLFIVFIWRGIHIALNSVDKFGCFIATGITAMVAIQVIINIAVVTNTIPNTGIPLPFISYGGTSLTIMMGSMGILLNISRFYRE